MHEQEVAQEVAKGDLLTKHGIMHAKSTGLTSEGLDSSPR